MDNRLGLCLWFKKQPITLHSNGEPMNTYFVDYTYNTTGANFQAKYTFVRVQANSPQEAIAKARRQAPKNATAFKAVHV